MAIRRRSAAGMAVDFPRGAGGRGVGRAVGLPAIGAGSSCKKALGEGMSRRAPAKPLQQSKGGGNSRAPPHPREVIAAVESLYADELKPYGRILRKRITERAHGGRSGDGDVTTDVDIRQLRSVCASCSSLKVEDEEGGDWSAVLVNRRANFVDIYSPRDDYSPNLWRAASAYFESLPEDQMTLPGGRYACALVLISRHLPFLEGRSLGQVCHIVQLAISQKKVLGYLNGSVVPYGKSQSMVKELCASSQQPCSGNGRDAAGLQLADWETARRCLRDILETAAAAAASQGSPQGPGIVPLSNVKRLFRSRFNIELSETMLGHSKLSELLQDHRFADVCRVKLEGHGYIVVQNSPRRQARPISPPPGIADGAAMSSTMPATINVGNPKKAFHNKVQWDCMDGFLPDEPAKIFLKSGHPTEQSVMIRHRRPAPISTNDTFSPVHNERDNGRGASDINDQEWLMKMMQVFGMTTPSPLGSSSSAGYTDSTCAETCQPFSALASPGMPSEFLLSPSSSLSPGESPAQATQRNNLLMSRRGLPPPPTIPPPPPPGLMMPKGLSKALRPPPGLPAPPGLEPQLWAMSANACETDIAPSSPPGEEAMPFLAEEQDSPDSSSAGSGMVLCLSDHV
eukprot:gb/GFBE01021161.1/.p1 GENE.gb/GFBE01021161.1/~~gb/GFBE01021161.1/.p1  ORF type:complete len:627 (+),score=117.70 gb/GFBE01021161.1/:1-1881(+)